MQNQNSRRVKYYFNRKVKTLKSNEIKQKIRNAINSKGFCSNILKEEHETPLLLASRYLAKDNNWQSPGFNIFYPGVDPTSWKCFIYGLRSISLEVYQAYSYIIGLEWIELVEYEPENISKISPNISVTQINFNQAPQLQKILVGHQGCIGSVAIHPNKKIIATGSWDKNIILWDLANETKLYQLQGHTHQVTAVCFSPCGELLLSSSYDYSLRLWDLREGTLINTLFRQSFPPVNTTRLSEVVAFSPDGNLIVSGGLNNKIYLWDKLRFFDLPIQTLECPASVISLTFSRDGRWLAAGCANGIVRVWKFSDQSISDRDLVSNAEWVTSLKFSPDSHYLFAGLKNGNIIGWELATNKLLEPPLVLHKTPVSALTIHPYEITILASGDMSGLICLWNWPEGKPLYDFPAHRLITTSLCFTNDGECLVSGGGDNTAKLWQFS